MLSESTARLVEGAGVLGEPQLVRIKGADDAVPARQLLSVVAHRTGVSMSTLGGRDWELSTVTAMLDRATSGRGSVVALVGPPGIGKTRLTGEAVRIAKHLGIEAFSTFGESHATDIPFHVVGRLLRAIGQLNTRVPDADPQDLLLLDDLLGIADPNVALPKIDPDARRRRLTALINAAQLARTEPAVFVVEDAHWIDEVSESMIADFLAVVPQSPALVLITYRPEYHGALARVAGSQTITLAPLTNADTSALVAELLGPDPSVSQIGATIARRAAGNPFFAEEITRDLAERGVLVGTSGHYACHVDVADVNVPATLQAAIASRIDRLGSAAKHTLAAASVIGARFDPDLLATLEVDPGVDELIAAELVDQVRFTPHAEYAFRHPLIRAVAYESQLRSDRTRLHRRLATAIERQESTAADQNAALIAEHLESAGDQHDAYRWHMRAATWATNRDINAARLSWERAVKIADCLPPDDPNQASWSIAPRTMLCGTAWRVHEHVAGARFDELRELCTVTGDKASLAIAMFGLVMDHLWQDHMREASRLASETWALIESLGDPNLTVGLATTLIYARSDCAEWSDALRWSQTVIDLADGDPSKGNFITGSPLALAFMTRSVARYCLGHAGWRDDFRHGLTLARDADPMSYAFAVAWAYFPAISNNVLRPDDSALHVIEEALRIAERSSDDVAVTFVRATLAVALVHRQAAADRDRGEQLLAETSDVLRGQRYLLSELPLLNVYLARETARRGDRDDAIGVIRANVNHLFREQRLLGWGIPTTGVLVETLLDRGANDDLVEAEAAIERLAAAQADEGLVIRDMWVLRSRALLAQARGDATYTNFRDRYREMAKTLGFEGHIARAEAMP
jgi:AAA ATPase domain